eukprot:TRINITY_DN348_c1_g2_i2.p1 TRINITY_DN348_c1_g2~~TRINITY_DN348_c1_g2_i2.p1  ORF type:complete len:280 (+),score=59.88 TRINITY_DN348_c1_g2_i2:85-840(+)
MAAFAEAIPTPADAVTAANMCSSSSSCSTSTCVSTASSSSSSSYCGKKQKRVHLKKRGFLEGLVPIAPVHKVVPACPIDDSDHFASRILPWLYLGGVRDTENPNLLREHGITHIVDLTPESNATHWKGISYLPVPVQDHSDQQITPHFNKIIAFIESAKQNNTAALVHCRLGISRSATAVIAYLMKMLCVPFVLARDIVRQCRPSINPNMGFITALTQYERQNSIDLSTPMSEYKVWLQLLSWGEGGTHGR